MPSENFDPVEVAALQPEEIERNVAAAIEAFTNAHNLDELKAAALAHEGARGPPPLPNREMGPLPPAARKAAGQRIGPARGRVKQALMQRQQQLEEERDQRVLVEEAADVTLPTC